jgi:hypothetical protein
MFPTPPEQRKRRGDAADVLWRETTGSNGRDAAFGPSGMLGNVVCYLGEPIGRPCREPSADPSGYNPTSGSSLLFRRMSGAFQGTAMLCLWPFRDTPASGEFAS